MQNEGTDLVNLIVAIYILYQNSSIIDIKLCTYNYTVYVFMNLIIQSNVVHIEHA